MQSSLTKTVFLSIASALMLTWALNVSAHHSRSRFDMSEIVELEGELTIFSWRNPHVRIQVRTTDESGNDVYWDMEGDSLSILRRTSAKPEGIEVGTRVKIAGYPTLRPSQDMLIHNLLTSDGREVLVNISAEPRWSDIVSGGQGVWLTAGTAEDKVGDIFRVWSTSFGPQGTFGNFYETDYPLTDIARASSDAWDPTVDVTARGCEPKGMPLIMSQPYPIEFVDQGDTIVLRIEEYDTVRTIHMGEGQTPATSILGHSTGRWDGNTLVVSTSHIDYPYFDENGVPMGSDTTLLERFRVSGDNSRLEYEVLVKDDEIFTAPVTLTRKWDWRPGEQVEPYECVD